MNRFWRCAFLCLGALVAAPAGADPALVLSGIEHQALFAASFDGAKGYAVGAHGQIFVSADAGKTWKMQLAPKEMGLLGVAAKAGHVIAVGQMGTVVTGTGDGHWAAVDVGNIERLMSVDLNSKGLAIAVGSFGTVLRSTDSGASWTPVKPDWKTLFSAYADTLGENFGPHLYSATVGEDGSVLIAGELSTILRSADGGQTWKPVHQGGIRNSLSDPSIFALRLRGDGIGIAVGQSGQILRSSDGGSNWAQVDSGSHQILLGAEFDAAGNAIVTGMREMLRSTDAGQSWTQMHGGDLGSAWYSAAIKVDGAPGVLAVGQAGRILKVAE